MLEYNDEQNYTPIMVVRIRLGLCLVVATHLFIAATRF